MCAIILAIPNQTSAKHIATLLRRHGIDCPIFYATSAASTVRQATASDGGIVIATPTLSDTSYTELYDLLPERFSLLILTRDEGLDILGSRMACITLPIRGLELARQVKIILQGERKEPRASRPLPLHEKKSPPPRVRTQQEEAVIRRAKNILMAKGNLTEDAAHRTLQQKAMQERRTLLDVAQLLVLLHQDWQHSP